MAANFKARAKAPGRCALKGCCLPGDKIYEGDGLRLLACTQGHANAVLGVITGATAALGATREQRDAALRLLNRQPEAVVEDDFDIPI